MNKELFLKNTQALFEVDQILAYELRKISQTTRFKLIDGKIFDQQNQIFLDENHLFDFDKFEFYPVLFFYGFGSGSFFFKLLENKHLKHIVIFEDELEILHLAFYLYDFSHFIKKEKLILFYPPHINTAQLNILFNYPNIKHTLKIFNFNFYNEFYTHFYLANAQKIMQILLNTIKTLMLAHGNDPKDALLGIKHNVINLEKIISHTPLKNLIKEKKAKAKNAIIVSTGPSLTKQLPLLKQYQDNVVIFSADSSYAILANAGIKPDYVFSLERVDFTSEFFNNDFKEIDQNILFIIASLTHPNTVKYLEKNNRNYMLVLRPLFFESKLGLNEYGFLGNGMSVANMAYELAGGLRFENIILIGQDLAYDDDGKSHPKEHLYGEQGDEEVVYKMIPAYGGKGEVKTQLTWYLFLKSFEKDIALARDILKIKTYNATEGGARIEGAIEKPFKELCETLLKEKIVKNNILAKPKNPQKKIKQCKERLSKLTRQSEIYINECKKAMQEKNLEKLEKLRLKLPKSDFFSDILQARCFQNECEVLKYKVEKDKNTDLFLMQQIDFFQEVILYLEEYNKTIKENLKA
ncbi:motility associated factor glycosyltransferase family protein [Campylobacter sp. 2014D-0216]|uniref:motility associated factor glycosyltransferase family protein n=1 Tax=Campylobacter sp. 2014D-0216 TaxID=1813595 RepID=UPI0018A52BB8|nr:6-hydroxymethylpterin diphosphokinase MptE-like protein [Campylobacter sp. 2014D-0216]QOR01348.1 motility associated factor glycosyltransferase family protein [Campylobacter sp. 2014D-0216]